MARAVVVPLEPGCPHRPTAGAHRFRRLHLESPRPAADRFHRRHWLRLRLVGTKSNRDGIGAVVRVSTGGGTQWQTVHSGSSYCSSSDLALTFGLGNDNSAMVEIHWPSGTIQKLEKVKADQHLQIQEK